MSKKKGSSLLTVMVVSMVLIVMATLVGSAIVFNTTGNAVTKESNDLLYAAESGIDRGVSEIYKAEKISSLPPSAPFDISDFVDTYGIGVSIQITKKNMASSTGHYYEIKSTATNEKAKSRTVTATVKKNLGCGDIFSKLACGEEILTTSGSLNLGSGDINSSNSTPIIDGASVVHPDSIMNAQFTVPIYNFEKMDSTSGKTEINIANGDELITELDKLESQCKGVRKISFTSHNVTGNFDVYLLNADDLTINATNLTLNRKILLSSGNLKITANAGATMNVSFIGKKVELPSAGAMHMTFAPYIPVGHTMEASWKPHSALNDEDLIYLNSKINEYATNWNEGLNAGSGIDYWSAISYEYD